jgi:ParB/RepB/Spo0J family partition protein
MDTLPYKELVLEGADFANPRQTIDKRSISELADSIASQGLLYSLLVWQAQGDSGKSLNVILDGGRRYRAIGKLIKDRKANGLSKAVPVTFIEAATLAEAKIKALTTSVQREELSSYEVAAAIAEMVESGQKQKGIAKLLGKSQTWVSRQLSAFRSAAEQVKEAWQGGILPDDDVQHLAKLEEDDQLKRLDEILALREQAADVAGPTAAAPKGREAKAKARQIAKGKNDKPSEAKKIRPSVEVLEGFAAIAGQAPKKEAYIRGMHDGILFALGELGAGEFAKPWRDHAAKNMASDSDAKARK